MQADGGRPLPLSMASAFDGFQDGLLGEILSHCFASMSPDDLARASSCCKAWADSNGWCENYAARWTPGYLPAVSKHGYLVRLACWDRRFLEDNAAFASTLRKWWKEHERMALELWEAAKQAEYDDEYEDYGTAELRGGYTAHKASLDRLIDYLPSVVSREASCALLDCFNRAAFLRWNRTCKEVGDEAGRCDTRAFAIGSKTSGDLLVFTAEFYEFEGEEGRSIAWTLDAVRLDGGDEALMRKILNQGDLGVWTHLSTREALLDEVRVRRGLGEGDIDSCARRSEFERLQAAETPTSDTFKLLFNERQQDHGGKVRVCKISPSRNRLSRLFALLDLDETVVGPDDLLFAFLVFLNKCSPSEWQKRSGPRRRQIWKRDGSRYSWE